MILCRIRRGLGGGVLSMPRALFLTQSMTLRVCKRVCVCVYASSVCVCVHTPIAMLNRDLFVYSARNGTRKKRTQDKNIPRIIEIKNLFIKEEDKCGTSAHTHTHTLALLHMYVCMCVCVEICRNIYVYMVI